MAGGFFIRIKCPTCGKLLKLGVSSEADLSKFDPSKKKGNLTCPNCKEKQPWSAYKVVEDKTRTDETQIVSPLHDTIGRLLDESTRKEYPLKEGRLLIGRMTYKAPPKADIPVETKDLGFSRSQFYLRVMKGRDGRYHTYISEASHSNPTFVNGQQLSLDDENVLKNNDRITVSETTLKFIGTLFDDETEVRHMSKSSGDDTAL